MAEHLRQQRRFDVQHHDADYDLCKSKRRNAQLLLMMSWLLSALGLTHSGFVTHRDSIRSTDFGQQKLQLRDQPDIGSIPEEYYSQERPSSFSLKRSLRAGWSKLVAFSHPHAQVQAVDLEGSALPAGSSDLKAYPPSGSGSEGSASSPAALPRLRNCQPVRFRRGRPTMAYSQVLGESERFHSLIFKADAPLADYKHQGFGGFAVTPSSRRQPCHC